MKQSKVFSCIVLISFVFSLFLSTQPVKAQSTTIVAPPGSYVPGEVVVVFKPGRSMAQYATAASALGVKTQTRPEKVGAGGMALLKTDSSTNVNSLVQTMMKDSSVAYAEPNYIYQLPKETADVGNNYVQKTFALRPAPKNSSSKASNSMKKYEADPIAYLQSMKTIKGGVAQATYPNDPYLWWNSGWDVVDADIVSSNTTASAGICELDTGVDYLHPDLAGRIIKGYDFVNGDADPMDDFGHGTHVAGILTAVPNNGKGIAGASNAKVVAVKVLGAQGWGTNYDIAQGINFCANRPDVKVLTMSLGGQYSQAIDNAVAYAVNSMGKLVVAAAGNSNTDDITGAYPGALSIKYPNKVLSVAASGAHETETDGNGNTYTHTDYGCRASYSNYGSWVSVIAPGTDIYSTTPYDKPFWLNYFENVNPRYAYLSGTSMATPFVAAAAARRWGYQPAENNLQVGYDVVNSGWTVNADDTCWPSTMSNIHQVNIANLLDRYSLDASVADASTGVGLTGATVYAYNGATLAGSSVITPNTMGTNSANWPTISDIFYYYTAYTDIINLPVPTNGSAFYDYINGYTYKASKTGYTASPQLIFQHDQHWVNPATLYLNDRAGIPPMSSNVDVVMGFTQNVYNDFSSSPALPYFDLDLDVWLPATPNPLDSGQPAPFIVGWEGNSFGYLEQDPSGSMNVFPFARYKREGGNWDGVPIEDTTISSRLTHAPLAANKTLPYYPGSYVVGVTDYGKTFDPGDGSSIPVMGAYAVPYVYIWKDGTIKLFNMMDYESAGGPCNTHWWNAATISSGVSGAITYTLNNSCSNDTSIFPY